MEISTFDNTIDVDKTYVPPEVDEECLIESNFPCCSAGRWHSDCDLECGLDGCFSYRFDTDNKITDPDSCYGHVDWDRYNGLCNPSNNFFYSYDHLRVPPAQESVAETQLRLYYGMASRFIEPWFECAVTQRYNDFTKGYIHGIETSVQVFHGAYQHQINVGALELTGKHVDSCYFDPIQGELVAQVDVEAQNAGAQVYILPDSSYQELYEKCFLLSCEESEMLQFKDLLIYQPGVAIRKYISSNTLVRVDSLSDAQLFNLPFLLPCLANEGIIVFYAHFLPQIESQDLMVKEPDTTYPTDVMPNWLVSRSHGSLDGFEWIQGGTLHAQTEMINYDELEGRLWLGYSLSNGQFYQATITAEFESLCAEHRFYEERPTQIVYVSISDQMPFTYTLKAFDAITPEIARVCKAEEPVEYLSLGPKPNHWLIEAAQLSISEDEILIEAAPEDVLHHSIDVLHYSYYSDYLIEPLVTTIKIRFVCLASQFEVPLAAYPPNIFEVLSFEKLLDGSFFQGYILDFEPYLKEECALEFPQSAYLRVQGSDVEKVPDFIDFQDGLIILSSTPASAMLLDKEQLFRRYDLELVYTVLNMDFFDWALTDFETQSTPSDQYDADSNGGKQLASSIVDSAGREVPDEISVALPFVVSLQELGKENKPPSFNTSATELADFIEALPGKQLQTNLPRPQDPENDAVTVSVQLDGKQIGSEPDAAVCQNGSEPECFVLFIEEDLLIDVYFPADYFTVEQVEQPEPVIRQVSKIFVFDDNGDLIETEAFLEPDPVVIRAPQEVEVFTLTVSLDDGTQIVTHTIGLTVGEGMYDRDQSEGFSPQQQGGDGNGDGLFNNAGSQRLSPDQTTDPPKEEVKVAKTEGDILQVDDQSEFDFMEWLDKQQDVQQKMKNYRYDSQNLSPSEIPWPQVPDQMSSDGRIVIGFAEPVNYRSCSSCLSTGKNRRELQDASAESTKPFYQREEYKQALIDNGNIKVKLIPSSASDQKQLSFVWGIKELTREGIELELEFAQPEFVSLYEVKDMIQIKFVNTHEFMVDQEGYTDKILPSGYNILVQIPRQSQKGQQLVPLLPNLDKESLTSTSQTLITTVPIVSFFFNLSMQQLWGSVTSLQITASLPIINLTMPPNVTEFYSILISVVTFDFFDYIIDGVDFGQTETQAWSEGFETLSMESLNVIPNLFSVHVFMTFLLGQALLGLALKILCASQIKHWRCCMRCRNYSVRETLMQGCLRVLLTTFLDILLCCSIGLGLFRLSHLNRADKVTIGINLVYLFILAALCALLVWFIFRKAQPLVQIKARRDKLELLSVLKVILNRSRGSSTFGFESIESVDQIKLKDLERRKTLVRAATLKLNQIKARTMSVRRQIANQLDQQDFFTSDKIKAVIKEASIDDEIEVLQKQVKADEAVYVKLIKPYQKYMIFFEGRKLTYLGLSESLFFVVRRALFVAVALFLSEGNNVKIAILIFMLSSYLNVLYIVTVHPFTEREINRNEAVNELFVLCIGYLAFILLDQSVPRVQILHVGQVMKGVISLCVALNFLFLFAGMCSQLNVKTKKALIKRYSASQIFRKYSEQQRRQIENNLVQSLKQKPHERFAIRLKECRHEESSSEDDSLDVQAGLAAEFKNSVPIVVSQKQARFRDVLSKQMGKSGKCQEDSSMSIQDPESHAWSQQDESEVPGSKYLDKSEELDFTERRPNEDQQLAPLSISEFSEQKVEQEIVFGLDKIVVAELEALKSPSNQRRCSQVNVASKIVSSQSILDSAGSQKTKKYRDQLLIPESDSDTDQKTARVRPNLEVDGSVKFDSDKSKEFVGGINLTKNESVEGDFSKVAARTVKQVVQSRQNLRLRQTEVNLGRNGFMSQTLRDDQQTVELRRQETLQQRQHLLVQALDDSDSDGSLKQQGV